MSRYCVEATICNACVHTVLCMPMLLTSCGYCSRVL